MCLITRALFPNGFCLFTDVLSSLSSMSSLTPEQSANATPDASLQPSSINSAQRYFIYLHLCISFKTDIYNLTLWYKTA